MLEDTGDQRKVVRRPTDLTARVCLDGAEPELPCRILDISDEGARLILSRLPRSPLPGHFTLMLGLDGRVRRECELVWADAKRIGVKFESAPPAP